MGLFDRVRAFAQRSSPAPEGAAKAPSRSAKGRSGTVNVGGFISDDEMNVLLRWPQNLQVYDEMRRTDSMVRWMLGLAKYPMLATPKSIEPASQEPEHLEHAAFVEHVFFGGELDGGFNEFLRQALTFFEFGHSLFERIADLREVSFSYREAFVLAKLAPRLQRTIQKWNPKDKDPSVLTSVEQFLGDGIEPPTVTIDADRLVVFSFEKEGDDWRGTSLLRPAYKAWKFKSKLEQLEGIAAERSAGLPVVYPPEDADDDDINDLEKTLKDIRQGESLYLIMPGPKAESAAESSDGWTFEEVTIKASEADFGAAIQRWDGALARNVLAEFMRLGHENVGARATADVQQDPYYAALQAITIWLEQIINEQIVRPLIDWNYQVDGRYPKFKFAKITGKNLEAIATYISTLVSGKVIKPDPDLEAWVRDQAEMPEAAPVEEPEPPEGAEGVTPPGQPGPTDPKTPDPGKAEKPGETEEQKTTAAQALEAVGLTPEPGEAFYYGAKPSERDSKGRFKDKGGGFAPGDAQPDVPGYTNPNMPSVGPLFNKNKLPRELAAAGGAMSIVNKRKLKGDGSKAKPIGVKGDLDLAALLIADGKYVELEQPDEVATLLERLAKMDREGKTYDLCKVTVPGTNLFCSKSKGIPRVQMPQLKGVPTPGTRAGKMTPDERGEVDITPMFGEYLRSKGLTLTPKSKPASHLRATQNELNGSKVAGITGFLRGGGELKPQDFLVSHDNYIVDGHHRWASQVAVDTVDNDLGDVEMDVIEVNAGIGTILHEANEFAKEMGIPQAAVGNFVKKFSEMFADIPEEPEEGIVPLPPGTARYKLEREVREEMAAALANGLIPEADGEDD
jgi:hypothetical protein